MTTTCTSAEHEAIKADLQTWNRLVVIGVQVIEAWEDEPEERLQMRNCECGSTLCKAI